MRGLHVSDTLHWVALFLGDEGRNNFKPSNGSSGHAGGTRPGQTRKKPKDLSTRERRSVVLGRVVDCVVFGVCHFAAREILFIFIGKSSKIYFSISCISTPKFSTTILQGTSK